MTAKRAISITVNGTRHAAEIEPRLTLADYLRENLDLTGTHLGCEHGVCGACTVFLDGDSIRACLCLAVQADGCEVETVEGMGTVDDLSPLQKNFRAAHGLQCGFCTPGMLVTSTDMLKKYPLETDAEIRRELSGNICRCTGYQNIVKAVRAAVDERDGADK